MKKSPIARWEIRRAARNLGFEYLPEYPAAVGPELRNPRMSILGDVGAIKAACVMSDSIFNVVNAVQGPREPTELDALERAIRDLGFRWSLHYGGLRQPFGSIVRGSDGETHTSNWKDVIKELRTQVDQIANPQTPKFDNLVRAPAAWNSSGSWLKDYFFIRLFAEVEVIAIPRCEIVALVYPGDLGRSAAQLEWVLRRVEAVFRNTLGDLLLRV